MKSKLFIFGVFFALLVSLGVYFNLDQPLSEQAKNYQRIADESKGSVASHYFLGLPFLDQEPESAGYNIARAIRKKYETPYDIGLDDYYELVSHLGYNYRLTFGDRIDCKEPLKCALVLEDPSSVEAIELNKKIESHKILMDRLYHLLQYEKYESEYILSDLMLTDYFTSNISSINAQLILLAKSKDIQEVRFFRKLILSKLYQVGETHFVFILSYFYQELIKLEHQLLLADGKESYFEKINLKNMQLEKILAYQYKSVSLSISKSETGKNITYKPKMTRNLVAEYYANLEYIYGLGTSLNEEYQSFSQQRKGNGPLRNVSGNMLLSFAIPRVVNIQLDMLIDTNLMISLLNQINREKKVNPYYSKGEGVKSDGQGACLQHPTKMKKYICESDLIIPNGHGENS